MFAKQQDYNAYQKGVFLPRQAIVPLAAGCLMLAASLLPWMKEPLLGNASPWAIPIDIGWQFHVQWFNYGLLCVFCAVVAFYTAVIHMIRRKLGQPDWYVAPRYVSLGLLCMLPFLLLLLQYLFADRYGIDQITQHMNQALLIKQHLGYSLPSALVSLAPFKFTSATVLGRLTILVDVQIPSIFLPLASGLLLIGNQGVEAVPGWISEQKRLPGTVLFLFTLAVFIVFGRAPLATICEYNAKTAVSTGSMGPALKWMDVALSLNPALDQVTYFHVYRGEAYYTLAPYVVTDDTRIYLAFSYRSISDYLDAEEEMMALWHLRPTEPWVVSETSYTLELLSEFKQEKQATPLQRSENDTTSLTWVQQLLQVDPSNVYGHYVMGRLDCYLHGYNACIAQMLQVLQLSNDRDIQSTAYTYAALSFAGEGDLLLERQYLAQALKLDPYYHNNTAREELSGLH
ncbi:MAG TPA: hypothetical protein VKR06_06660 [Ktedonosporobacter sp.]|nr:hypothetical protein [Ktedonosporobacter sp.]